MRTSDRDTIAAIATAPGEGAIGIVRLTGDRAIAVAESCFAGTVPLREVEERKLTFGRLMHKDQVLDEVLVSVMKGPRTYTGEDTVEFNCHGGPYILGRAMEALLEAGARSADRGEFTRRAFLNGRLDLTQAEAVADLISARADLSLQSAYFQLRGGLAERFATIAEMLRQALVTLEAGLDFAEDTAFDLENANAGVSTRIRSAVASVDALVASYEGGRLIREGARVVLAGRPNVGKSSLMNRLLEEDRAIVTAEPGTTRDTIEESLRLDGAVATLVDTAGLRETGDPVELEGTRRSRLSIDSADLVLVVAEGPSPPWADELSLVQSVRDGILVVNKVDLGLHESWECQEGAGRQVRVSALTGAGIDDLRAQMRHRLVGRTAGNPEAVTHRRHADLLRHTRFSLEGALKAADAGLPRELVAMEVRGALDGLADIVGETTSDDILDRIFETFCIGK